MRSFCGWGSPGTLKGSYWQMMPLLEKYGLSPMSLTQRTRLSGGC
jgi:hypothetical protein